MAGLRDYREFDSWKLANEVRKRVWRLTAKPGFDEHLWLRSQLRRAANSACANHGEGFTRYRPKMFALAEEVAAGSLTEILEHMPDALALGLATAEEHREICSFARRGRGAMLGLIRYLKTAKAPEPRPGGRGRNPEDSEP